MVPVMIRVATGMTRGFLVNISSNGAQLVVDKPATDDGVVGLILSVGSDTYHHQAHVVRNSPDYGRHLLTVRFAPGSFERTSESRCSPRRQSQQS